VTALTNERAVETFLAALTRRNFAPATVVKQSRDLRTFLRLVAKPVAEVRREDVRRFLAERARTVCAESSLNELRVVRSLYGLLLDEGFVAADPTAGVEIDTPPPAPKLVLSEQQVARLLEAASEVVTDWPERTPEVCTAFALRNRALLELLYATGMRASEVAAIRVVDLSLDQAALLCRRAKRGVSRYLPIPKAALSHLERYLREGRPCLVKGGRDEGRLLITERGTPLRPIYVCELVVSSGKRIGLDVHPHAFRHALASHLVQAGVSIAIVKELLGHVRLSTTQRYVAVDRRALRKAVEFLEAHGAFRAAFRS
jgi:site-specific recombinase XerD